MQKLCRLDFCDRALYAKELCRGHYDANLQGRELKPLESRAFRKPRPKRSRACSIDGCTDPVAGRGWCQMHYQRYYQRKRLGHPEEVCIDVGRDLRETFVYDMEPEEELAQLIYEQEREMRYKDFAYPGTGESRVVVSHSAPINDDGFSMLDAIEHEQAEKKLYGGRKTENAVVAIHW